MKNLSLLLLVIAAPALAQASVVTIKCDQASDDVISRADSVTEVTYKVNLEKLTAKLGCAKKIESSFCQSIRMDLSKFVTAQKIHACVRSMESMYSFDFKLVQEDEFYNPVRLFISQDCMTGELKATASISNEISGDKPTYEDVAAVACKVIK